MKQISRFLFWFSMVSVASYLLWLGRSHQLRAHGSDLIRLGYQDKLEELVRGRPWLATELLGYTYESKERGMFEMLLAHGANVNVAQLQTEWGPYPLLHHFARVDDVYWLETAFAHGGDPNARSRFGITPFSEALDGRKSVNAMLAIKWGANVKGKIQNQPVYDLAVEMLLFEPAYKMLEMGVDPDGTLDEFPNAVHALRNCCTGIGFDADTLREAKENVWFQKIIEWYRERDRDLANATFETDGGDKQGKWRIPSFSKRERGNDNPP